MQGPVKCVVHLNAVCILHSFLPDPLLQMDPLLTTPCLLGSCVVGHLEAMPWYACTVFWNLLLFQLKLPRALAAILRRYDHCQ